VGLPERNQLLLTGLLLHPGHVCVGAGFHGDLVPGATGRGGPGNLLPGSEGQ